MKVLSAQLTLLVLSWQNLTGAGVCHPESSDLRSRAVEWSVKLADGWCAWVRLHTCRMLSSTGYGCLLEVPPKPAAE